MEKPVKTYKEINRDKQAHDIIKMINWAKDRIPRQYFTDKDRYIINLQTQAN